MVHAMTSEYPVWAASVIVIIPVSPCWDPSDYLSWTSAGQSCQLANQSTWLRGTAL